MVQYPAHHHPQANGIPEAIQNVLKVGGTISKIFGELKVVNKPES